MKIQPPGKQFGRVLQKYHILSDIIDDNDTKYKAVLEDIVEGYYETDLKGNILFCNKSFVGIIGLPVEQIKYKNYKEIMLPENSLQIFQLFHRVHNTGIPEKLTDWEVEVTGGTRKYLEISVSLIMDMNKPAGFRGFVHDVTAYKNIQTALRENKDKYRTLLDSLPEMVFEIDADGIFTFINKRVTELSGYTIKEIQGSNVTNYLEKDNTDMKDDDITNSLYSKNYSGVRFNFRTKSGALLPVNIYTNQIYINGVPSGMRGIAVDVTSLIKAERAIRESEEKFRSMIESSSEVIAIVDTNGTLTYLSQSLIRITGYHPEELLETQAFDLIHDDDRERILNLFNSAIREKIKHVIVGFRYKHKSGKWLYVEATATNLVDDPKINGLLLNMRDVTDRKKAEDDRKKAEEKAIYHELHDPMTGLPNREMLFKRIDSEILKAQTNRRKKEKSKDHMFAVMCLGLDKFKNINDMYGPTIGDKLLKKIGSRLKKIFRDNDLVSRLSGDRFMILFSDISGQDDIAEIVQKTFEVFTDSFVIGDNDFKITSSIGVCLYPNDGYNKELLIKNSESAMYLAKEEGRNTYRLFDAKMNAEMLYRLRIEKDLEKAIVQNKLQPYFQPKVSMDGAIKGMESLIRWIPSNEEEPVLPSMFIPIAEKNGIIINIGHLMLFQACSLNKKWQDAGYPKVPISINISCVQFKQHNLVLNIKDVLRQTGLSPEYLELEITESGIMENEELSIRKLNEIHDMGVKISIDDFGTGYSSLSKLKDYPVDTLKIDRSFIKNLPCDKKSSTLTTTIIDLAHNLGFDVVAEGVETKEQLDFLIKHNCDYFQGYYFSKPVPASEFEAKLKNNNSSYSTPAVR